MLLKKCADVFIKVLRRSNMVVFLWRVGHSFSTSVTTFTKFLPETAKTSFAMLDLSKLPDKFFFIRALVTSLGCSMLKLALITSER